MKHPLYWTKRKNEKGDVQTIESFEGSIELPRLPMGENHSVNIEFGKMKGEKLPYARMFYEVEGENIFLGTLPVRKDVYDLIRPSE